MCVQFAVLSHVKEVVVVGNLATLIVKMLVKVIDLLLVDFVLQQDEEGDDLLENPRLGSCTYLRLSLLTRYLALVHKRKENK